MTACLWMEMEVIYIDRLRWGRSSYNGQGSIFKHHTFLRHRNMHVSMDTIDNCLKQKLSRTGSSTFCKVTLQKFHRKFMLFDKIDSWSKLSNILNHPLSMLCKFVILKGDGKGYYYFFKQTWKTIQQYHITF
jgi:hypothetical protein